MSGCIWIHLRVCLHNPVNFRYTAHGQPTFQRFNRKVTTISIVILYHIVRHLQQNLSMLTAKHLHINVQYITKYISLLVIISSHFMFSFIWCKTDTICLSLLQNIADFQIQFSGTHILKCLPNWLTYTLVVILYIYIFF